MDQFFLSNPNKILTLLKAANIQQHESLLELGSGTGSIAKHFPPCKLVSMLELDRQLATTLRKEFPHAQIINMDAVKHLPQLFFDVLLSNLPHNLTDQILEILKRKKFRCAIMAVKIDDDIDAYKSKFVIDEIIILDELDFVPTQNYKSRLIRITPRI
jgi:16S rRNA A1518/A1519 N6-dimethyltransferase RsmA/KsgA/DIM1 with predicted DNA glycosylase/AP lyase activity